MTNGIMDVHFFWAGRGTCCIPYQSTYGPLVSAIHVSQGSEFVLSLLFIYALLALKMTEHFGCVSCLVCSLLQLTDVLFVCSFQQIHLALALSPTMTRGLLVKLLE